MAVVAVNVRVGGFQHIETLAFFLGCAQRIVPLMVGTAETCVRLKGVVSASSDTGIRLKRTFAPTREQLHYTAYGVRSINSRCGATQYFYVIYLRQRQCLPSEASADGLGFNPHSVYIHSGML